MLDLIIKNGEIIDGSGEKSYKADIGIKDSLIKIISHKIIEESKAIIDATEYVVSPGFIDIHSHSDFTLMINPCGESKIRQGITTEVVGNCGFTAAPVIPMHLNDTIQYLANTVILSDEEKKKWIWDTQGAFINEIGEKGISCNIASLVGQGSIRVGVMGFEKRKPTSKELEEMLKLLQSEMDKGIHGMSSGLEYEPGLYTSKEELIEMAKLIKAYDGIYATHMQNEGRHLCKSIIDSIEIADRSGVSLEISHLKASYGKNWGKVKDALRIIDDARASGIDLDFDLYPYTAYGSGLKDLIPPWVKEQGVNKMIEKLKNKSFYNSVIEDMSRESDTWENPMMVNEWEDVRVAMLKTERNRKYEGKNIAQIAKDMNCHPIDAVINLLIEEEGAIKTIFFAMKEEDLETIMRHPRVMFGTDGRAVAPYGELARGAVHPRYYGTYPRILGRYVREKNIISIEEAIKKMTFLPSIKMKFKKRGLIKENYYADITIFDKKNIIDVATFDDPHKYSKGIEYVIVNGNIVISKGEHTGNLPGRVL